MKSNKEDYFFVEIKNNSEIKRNILESTRSIVGLLHSYEKYKLIRHEREKASIILNKDIKEMSKLAKNLKLSLPPVKVKIPKVKQPVPIKQEIKPEKKQHEKKIGKPSMPKPEPKPAQAVSIKPIAKEMTELEKLESELKAIEDKLKSLG